MKAYRGSKDIPPRILNPGTEGTELSTLPSEKRLTVHWTGLWMGTAASVIVEGKNLLTLPGFEPT